MATQAELTAGLAGKQGLDADLTAIAALATAGYGRSLLELASASDGRTLLGLGTAATHAHGDYDLAGAAAAAQAASQPLDADLTTIAGLTATTDRIIQSKSSAWTTRTPAQFKTDLALTSSDVGLGSVTNADHAAALAAHLADTVDAHDASAISFSPTGSISSTDVQAAIAEVASEAAGAPAASAVTYAGSTNLSAANVEAALDELDAEKQPLDADLTTIAGLTATTDSFMQAKSSAWASRTIAQVKTDLGISNVDNLQQQPIDSDLTAIAALSPTNDDIIQRKSGAWVARSMAQLKADLPITKLLGSRTTATGAIVNSETLVLAAAVAANQLAAGDLIICEFAGEYSATSSTAVTLRFRFGSAGTTSDSLVHTHTTAAGGTTTVRWTGKAIFTIRTSGVVGTFMCAAEHHGIPATGFVASGLTAPANLDTTAARFIDLTAQTGGANTNVTFHQAAFYVVKT
jgi:hypothetical protein